MLNQIKERRDTLFFFLWNTAGKIPTYKNNKKARK